MKMKASYNSEIILSEMNKLINFSCQGSQPELTKFQNALIKKYFKAMEVGNNLEKKEIYLKLMMDNNRFSTVTVAYKNFESFLQSCIEDKPSNLGFYQHMLSYYNVSVNAA